MQCTSALTLYFLFIHKQVPSHFCTSAITLYFFFSVQIQHTMYQCPHTVLLFICRSYSCISAITLYCSFLYIQCTSALTLYFLCSFIKSAITLCTSAITLYLLFLVQFQSHNVPVPSHCTLIQCHYTLSFLFETRTIQFVLVPSHCTFSFIIQY